MASSTDCFSLTAFQGQSYPSNPLEATLDSNFRSLMAKFDQKADLLGAIPNSDETSSQPLQLLHTVLSNVEGPWPSLALIRCYSRLFKQLPEESKIRPDSETARLTRSVQSFVRNSYKSLLDFLPTDSRPALRTTDALNFITHAGLRTFVANFHLPMDEKIKRPVVAIALPNGPLLAATCVAASTSYTAAPINPAAGPEQFWADVTQARANCILTTESDYEKLGLRQRVYGSKIEIFFVSWVEGDAITIQASSGRALAKKPPQLRNNTADDIALILFTSGTSGTKKVVPLTLHSIITGVIFVMDSWGLTTSDTCLNMMPLYHVGGLIRNIFAPLFSGGSTVCCSAFDPNMFWDVVESIQPTWYYASPSMHSIILAEASTRPQALSKSRFRLACNAAGGLLPSLACQLRDTFDCVVLPSYGMTECMPISTPPLNYVLDREGTSGVSTGPELTILNWSDDPESPGKVGRICVRGEPVFPGYLKTDGSYDRSPFTERGWFDTGDLGYMDAEGYLYITGRSKEVINRGGELISPFEVENAIVAASMAANSPISGRISQALAFSVDHDVLQEVVGVVLVTPPSMPRVDLKVLHEALRSSLQQVKWPVLITYMDDLPKKNNKVLRIKLGQRLRLPELDDATPFLQRHWEATCPPQDTELSVPIASSPCTLDDQLLSSVLCSALPIGLTHHVKRQSANQSAEVYVAPKTRGSQTLTSEWSTTIKMHLHQKLHGYMVPEHIRIMPDPFVRTANGEVDEHTLQEAVDKILEASLEKLAASTEGRVIKAFAEVLSCEPGDVSPDVDFFSLGGDSLKAGRLLSMLRAEFNIHLPISLIFADGTACALANHIDTNPTGAPLPRMDNIVGSDKVYSSTNPFLMLLQLAPIMVVYPLRRSIQWSIFIITLSQTQSLPTHQSSFGRLLNLVLCMSFARVVVRTIAPLIGILAKWTIIGRYREGIYPMWGLYHTRWWLVEKILSVCGRGFFSLNDTTKGIYCRLMGAKIGQNVKFGGVSLGEFDLLDIRDGASLTSCSCRPFAAEGNTSMYLGRIIIGENSSVGMSSIIAAGSRIPPNTCIGPNSSSWELGDADDGNRDLSPSKAPKPHWLLNLVFTFPLSVMAWFLSLLPWVGGLYGMVITQPLPTQTPLLATMQWFTAAERVAYHYLALVLRCTFGPFTFFVFTVLLKKVLDLMFGRMGASSTQGRNAISTWRASVIKSLLPVSRLHDVTGMFGQHYEATSIALRMLGAKIGKRVYWPGTGPGIGDYHLLDVGNDVVFGSRAHLVTSDGLGSETIKIHDRAMIADRVCLLPGVEVGERATMGSGALTRRGGQYFAESIYVGSKAGDALCLSTGLSSMRVQKMNGAHQVHHMSSDDTLRGDGTFSKKSTTDPRLRRTNSDDTLAAPQEKPVKSKYEINTDPFADSDTESQMSINASTEQDNMSPFGRAFHLRLAPYHVFGPIAIFFYSSFFTIFTKFYWNVPSISAIQLVNFLFHRFMPSVHNMWWNVLALWLMTWLTIAVFTTLEAVLALLLIIASKWALIGRRAPGNYDWDKSPYCQRWQLFLSIEKLRRHCYRGHGILGMLTGTHWIVLYFRALGAKIGKDCALFANGRPSLMFTEPDLITLGDRVNVDDASVVAHINTRGKFDLNRLEIEDRCVLRSGSRLLSGAKMKKDSCLLEHTLIMGGDVVEERWTMQGWPAERYSNARVRKAKT